MELPNPSFQRPLNEPIEPAQNLQNLTTAQSTQIIENTDGMQDAIGEVETVDYNDPDLELDTRREDNLENDIYDKSFKKTTENDLLAFSKNKTVEEIQTAHDLIARVKTEYKGNNFNADIQKFVKTL